MARQATTDTDLISFGNVTALNGLSDASWCFWVYIDSWIAASGNAWAFLKGSSFGFYQNNPFGEFFIGQIFWPTTDITYALSSYAWTTGTWHFVGQVLDRDLSSQRVKVYASVAGASSLTLAGSNDLNGSGTIGSTANALLALQDGGNTNNLRMRIANVALYNRPLSLGELKAVRDCPSAVIDGRVFFAPCWGDSPETEYSGSKLHGTLTGTTLVPPPPTGPIFDVGVDWVPFVPSVAGGGGGGHRELTTVGAG